MPVRFLITPLKRPLICSLVVLYIFLDCLNGQDFSGITLLYHDNFDNPATISNWVIEQTQEGKTSIIDDQLDINGGGCTVWYKEILNGPVLIEYEAELVVNGEEFDNCRDLNCFFMARHPRAPYDLFEGWRSNSVSRGGSFKNYHELRTYYFGIGGHKNTTSRFRRYTGHGNRPLLPEHDLKGPEFDLEANKVYKMKIHVNGSTIKVFRDTTLLFHLHDPQPYQTGWFGFRTVSNHLRLDNFRVYKIDSPDVIKNDFKTASRLGYNKNLTELGSRRGQKYYDDWKNKESHYSERVVFHDPETDGLIWKMTNDPAIETNEYTDIPVWSADGKTMLFITARKGENERWLMSADGSSLRPLNTHIDIPGGKGYWSQCIPDIIYYPEKELSNGEIVATKVIAANVESGEKEVIINAPRDLGRMMPPHPEEKLFLFGDHMGGRWEDKEHVSRAHIVDRSGEVSTVNFGKLYHRLRFTKADNGRIFFNFDKPRRSWTCLPDGSDRREIKINGGHPDWMNGGEWIIFNAREELPDGTKNFDLRYDAIRYDGTGLRTLYPYGGHASICQDGLHMVCDGGPGAGSVNYVSINEKGTYQNLFMNHTSRYDHSNDWHPNHHSTHPHPNCSPDGTKVMSNSDVLGQYTDIYVSVAKYPEPPTAKNAVIEGKHTTITWDPPNPGKEISGYNIYASKESGMNYKLVASLPSSETSFLLKSKERTCYVITAVEFSGLESRVSNEIQASAKGDWKGYVRIPIEAETGDCTFPVVSKMDMKNASNGYFLMSRDEEREGSVHYTFNVPVSGEYVLWGLCTGHGSIEVLENGTAAGSFSGPEFNWSWQKLNQKLQLKKGNNELTLVCRNGSEAIDKLFLSNDMHFMPRGLMQADEIPPVTPSQIEIQDVITNAIHLCWEPVNDALYYNVYAFTTPDFRCDQYHLISSTTDLCFNDWGLQKNSEYYYRVSAVDRQGNESEPSQMIHAKTPNPPIHKIHLKPSVAFLENGAVLQVDQIAEDAVKLYGKGSRATFKFQIEEEGTYTIWGFSVLPFNKELTNNVTIDHIIQTEWKIFGLYNTWQWSPMGIKTSGSAEEFYLRKGAHTLSISSDSGPLMIGDVILTNDPTYWPVKEMKSTGY